MTKRVLYFICILAILSLGLSCVGDNEDEQISESDGYVFNICVDRISFPASISAYTFEVSTVGIGTDSVFASLNEVDTSVYCALVQGRDIGINALESKMVLVRPDPDRELGLDEIKVYYLPYGYGDMDLDMAPYMSVPFDEDSQSYRFQTVGVLGDIPFIPMEEIALGSTVPALIPSRVEQAVDACDEIEDEPEQVPEAEGVQKCPPCNSCCSSSMGLIVME